MREKNYNREEGPREREWYIRGAWGGGEVGVGHVNGNRPRGKEGTWQAVEGTLENSWHLH